MADRQAKDALFEGLSSVAKALGNGRRAELVDVLAQGERRVEELAGEIGQSVANTSQHLQVLLRSGLVRTRRDGTSVYYSLSSASVVTLWQAVRKVAQEHIAELGELTASYLGDRSDLDALTREELTERLRAGNVVVLDVRPAAEYDAGHIPGARSIPVSEIAHRLNEIPADDEVVAYCRGQFCAFAVEAVRVLRGHGRSAAALTDGMLEWRLAGLPVEADAAKAVPLVTARVGVADRTRRRSRG